MLVPPRRQIGGSGESHGQLSFFPHINYYVLSYDYFANGCYYDSIIWCYKFVYCYYLTIQIEMMLNNFETEKIICYFLLYCNIEASSCGIIYIGVAAVWSQLIKFLGLQARTVSPLVLFAIHVLYLHRFLEENHFLRGISNWGYWLEQFPQLFMLGNLHQWHLHECHWISVANSELLWLSLHWFCIELVSQITLTSGAGLVMECVNKDMMKFYNFLNSAEVDDVLYTIKHTDVTALFSNMNDSKKSKYVIIAQRTKFVTKNIKRSSLDLSYYPKVFNQIFLAGKKHHESINMYILRDDDKVVERYTFIQALVVKYECQVQSVCYCFVLL